MEENTSKAYVATAGQVRPMAPASGAGSPLFVINLCASIAPVETSGRNLPGLDNYKLYQVSRVEDGRTRHRLRLGFFTSESHAESVLAVVRQQYPTAFTSCLCDEDRKFARGYLPESASASPPPRPVAVVVNTPAAAQPKPVASPKQATPVPAAPPKAAPAVAKAAPAPAKAQSAPAAGAAPKPAAAKTLAPANPEVIELTWEPEPAAKAPPATANTASTSKQRTLSPAEVLDELTWEPPSLGSAAGAGKSTSDTAKHPVLKAGYKTQPVVKAQPAPTAPPVAASKPAPKVDAATSMRVPALQLTLSDPPPPPPKQTATAPTEPFRVSKGVEIGDIGISLQAEPTPPVVKAAPAPTAKQPAPATKAAKPATAKPAAAKPTAPAPKPTTAPIQAKSAPTMPVQPTRMSLANLPDLDSTQTIRTLTSAELNDDSQEKWFAIQLAVSDQPVNLDAMPHLDIFEAYRLYSVANAGSGKIVHSLRLGFFKEAVSAEAVSGYLKTFFGSPSVLRISVAEHARFKDPPVRKARPESKMGNVVDLSARVARPVVPTVTMEVAVDPSATGSFKPNATGSFKPHATGSFQAGASGTHKTLKPAAKSAGTATKRGGGLKTGTSGKYKIAQPQKSLSQQLMDEAREVALEESGIRKLPKNDSLLSRLVGKLTK